MGPFVGIVIGVDRGESAGWGFFFGALVVAGSCGAVGLIACVAAELLTIAVRVVNGLKSIDKKLGTERLDSLVPAKNDERPDSPSQG